MAETVKSKSWTIFIGQARIAKANWQKKLITRLIMRARPMETRITALLISK